jgi:GNAT superfamily N-acetyltransferase
MMDQKGTIRDAVLGDAGNLATLWYDGWQDAHATIVPLELKRYRTLESFGQRIVEGLAHIRVLDLDGRIIGFTMRKGDELYQFFVAAEARGTGAAVVLMQDALACLREAGHRRTWLSCAIGNARAARFYEKTGWDGPEVFTSELATSDGMLCLEAWRYTIEL